MPLCPRIHRDASVSTPPTALLIDMRDVGESKGKILLCLSLAEGQNSPTVVWGSGSKGARFVGNALLEEEQRETGERDRQTE